MLTFQRSSKPTRVLITGGMGFVGSHLAEALLEQGHQVTAVDNLSTGRFENTRHLVGHPNFHFAIDDITNEVVLDRLVSKSDVIFHLAAAVGVQLIVKDPVRTVETNVLGTEAVLQAAVRYRTKVLIASTSEVYGKSQQIPFTEDDDVVLGSTARSRWCYAASKMVDEFLGLAYHRQKGLPVVVFRLFNTVGPRQTGQYGMVVPRFVQQALRGGPITVYGDGQQSRCFADVRDVVRALIGLAESPRAVGQVFNIGTRHEVTILDLAREVLRLVDARAAEWPRSLSALHLNDNGHQARPEHERITFVKYEDAYEAGFEEMRRRVPNTAKIESYIGWQPEYSLSQTLEDVITEFTVERSTTALAA
jgi:UDP-glucose 4-epimerase